VAGGGVAQTIRAGVGARLHRHLSAAGVEIRGPLDIHRLLPRHYVHARLAACDVEGWHSQPEQIRCRQIRNDHEYIGELQRLRRGDDCQRQDTRGAIGGLTVEADGTDGTTIDWFCAWDNLLENLQKCAKVGGGDFDVVKTSSTAWQYRFYTGNLAQTGRHRQVQHDPGQHERCAVPHYPP